jgi:hypothetical protein
VLNAEIVKTKNEKVDETETSKPTSCFSFLSHGEKGREGCKVI